MSFMVQFEKNTMGQLPANSKQFAEAVFESFRKWHKQDSCAVLYMVNELPGTVLAVEDQESGGVVHSFASSGWEPLLTEKIVLCKRNDGKLVKTAFDSWLAIPVMAKKKCAALLIIAREGKKMGSDEVENGKMLSQYLTTALKRIRKTNKKYKTYGEELRHRMLLDSQVSAGSRLASIPGAARAFDYHAGTGSDLNISTLQENKNWLCLTGDITASEQERQQAFIYIDTIFQFLSMTPLDALQILMKMNESLVTRASECYISAVIVRYLASENRVEIAGCGNTSVLYFSHESMTAKEFCFGTAAGVDRDADFSLSQLSVQTGDIFCIYTDGIHTAKKRNGEMFGKVDLAETVRKSYFLGATDLAHKIMEVLKEKEDPQVNGDDRTLQILKIE